MNNRIGNRIGRIGTQRQGHSLASWIVIARLMIAFSSAIAIGALLTTPALAWNETILYSFAGPPDGWDPGYNLIQDAAGNLYGITGWGGVFGWGTVFELSLQNGVWVETILHSFGGNGDGGQPGGSLVMDKAGNLYGTAHGVVYELTPDGQGNWAETILKAFKYPGTPFGGLALDGTGRLYGVASPGLHSFGLVYRLSPPARKGRPWKYFVLYSFKGHRHNDGENPNGNLVFDAAGNLYGTTWSGGSYDWGTVFELSPGAKTWTEKVLYSFQGKSDGALPNPGLVFDAEGNLYGTTNAGGNGKGGTVFELSPNGGNWTEALLYSFTGLSDGDGPAAPLTFHNGSLYGTTESGGDRPQSNGDGVVFELTPSEGGWTEQVLHTFTSSPDGATPYGGVVFDSSGNLYGTTSFGGILNSNCFYAGDPGCGVVYEISP